MPDAYCLCGCGQKTGVARGNDPRYGHIKGQHFTYRAGHHKIKRPDTLEGIIAACVPDENGCLNWTRSLDRKGYGQFVRKDGTKTGVHRVVYEMTHKVTLDRKTLVRHKCDNPKCCNYEHLEIGTYYDNNHDTKDRGRAAIGEKHGMAKLTEAKVIEILSSEHSDFELSEKYGVGVAQVRSIRSRSSWRHLEDQRPESIKARFGHKETKTIEWEGEAYSLRGLAKRCGISLSTLTKRLKRGWPIDDAVVPYKHQSKEEVSHEPKP